MRPGPPERGAAPWRRGAGSCATAFFARTPLRRGRSARKIATAHTLTDSDGDGLFPSGPGTGLGGLCGIPPRSRFPPAGIVWRALPQGMPRSWRLSGRWSSVPEMVERYLEGLGQPFRTDSTNLSDDYARNRIRHQVLPPCTRSTRDLTAPLPVWRSSTGRKNDYLNGLARALLTQAGYVREHPSKGAAPRSLPRGEPVLRRRAALLLLGDWGLPQERRWVEAILAGLERGGRG